MIAALRSLAAVAFCLAPLMANAAPVIPKLTGRVVDNANILSPDVRNRISQLSQTHEQRTTNQVVVLTVASLGGASIEEFANRAYSTWGLGTENADNGVLLVVAPHERRVRIEVGYGLEGTLTDAIASRIIRNTITPAFKAQNFSKGVDAGVHDIVRVLEGGSVAALESTTPLKGQASSNAPLGARIGIFIILLVVMSVFIAVALNAPGPLGWFIAAFVGLFLLVFPVALFGRGAGGIIFIAYLVLFPIAKLRGRQLFGQVRKRGWFDISSTDSWTDSSTSSWSSSDSGCTSSSDFSGGGGDSGGGGASGSW